MKKWLKLLAALLGRRKPSKPFYPIEGHDAEFRETTYGLYAEIGRRREDVSDAELAHWLHQFRYGMTGDQARVIFQNSEEGQAYRNRPSEPPPEQPAPPLPRLHVAGKVFATPDGHPWLWKMVTDFLLFERFQNDQNIIYLLRERKAFGANGVHVIGMCGFDGHTFSPDSWPNYYSALDAFFGLLSREGLYCEFVPLTGARTLYPGHDRQVLHAERCYEIARRHPHVLLELTNEYDHSFEVGLDVENFTQPAGLLWSRGSGTGDHDPAIPYGTHATFHPGRSDEWPRKMKTAMEYPVACANNEPMGGGEVDEPGRRSTNVEDFYDAGACAALTSAGATFMSEAGKWSEPFGLVQRRCAEAFFAGLNVIPAGVGDWTYAKSVPGGFCLEAHDNDGTPDSALRTFGMLRGNDQWCVVVRPGPTWKAKPINGWRIVETFGRGNVLRMTR